MDPLYVLELLDHLSCGAVLLAPGGEVLGVNAYARSCIRTSPISAKAAEPELKWTARVVQSWLGLPGKPGAVHCVRTNATRPMLLRRFSIGGYEMEDMELVLVCDLAVPRRTAVETVVSVFGLTAAEARLACEIASGFSLQQIANERKVSMGTLRMQLKSVLAKTQTHRQAELVALLSRLGSFA